MSSQNILVSAFSVYQKSNTKKRKLKPNKKEVESNTSNIKKIKAGTRMISKPSIEKSLHSLKVKSFNKHDLSNNHSNLNKKSKNKKLNISLQAHSMKENINNVGKFKENNRQIPTSNSTAKISKKSKARKKDQVKTSCSAQSTSTTNFENVEFEGDIESKHDKSAFSIDEFDQNISLSSDVLRSNTEEDSVENEEGSSEDAQKMSVLSQDVKRHSVEVATELFSWVLNPISVQRFLREYWESNPLIVKRKKDNYFSPLISTPEIDDVLRSNHVFFGKHLDVTSYVDGERETHNGFGRAQPHVVWDFYNNGCSVRLLNPQAFFKRVFSLTSTLQEFFGCFVGCNAYLTPPGTQGFAPHYDDIEAFVLQIEGKKHWKVYRPRNEYEKLPRYSSPNFSEEELGSPLLDVVLEAGDLLYFPRGYIHQACALPAEHSLHITVSAYQRTAWVDVLEKVLPMALKRAAQDSVAYRKGLPIGYLQTAGLGINPESHKKERAAFIKKAKDLVIKLAEYLDDFDTAVDQMGTQFMHDALPPTLSPNEKQNSVYGDGLYMKENGKLSASKEFTTFTRVKLLAANVCRLIKDDGEYRLYHRVDNSREYHGEEAQFIPLSEEQLPVVQYFIDKYPNFTAISEIPFLDLSIEDEKSYLVRELWERGLLLTDGPLEEEQE